MKISHYKEQLGRVLKEKKMDELQIIVSSTSDKTRWVWFNKKASNGLLNKLVVIITLLIITSPAQTPILHTRYDFINTDRNQIIKSFVFKEDLIKRVAPPRLILNTESLLAKAEMIDTVYYFYSGNLLIKQYNVMLVPSETE